MPGGLMQLVAHGASDIYLGGRPQHTSFRATYRRHSNVNFATESIENNSYAEPVINKNSQKQNYNNIIKENTHILQNDINECCEVCLCDFNKNDNICIFGCCHYVCTTCVQQLTNHKCPKCRETIVSNKTAIKIAKNIHDKQQYNMSKLSSYEYSTLRKILVDTSNGNICEVFDE